MKQKQLEYDNASDIYNKLFNFNTKSFQITKKLKKNDKHSFKYLFLEGCNFNKCFDIQGDKESDDDKTLEGDQEEIVVIQPMLLLQVDEGKVTEEKGMKILIRNKPDFQY